MRTATARAIIRAGLTLQEALRMVEEDDTCPVELVTLLGKLTPAADRLVDVPLPPSAEADPEPAPSTSAVCSSCGQLRIITNLSGPCPRCGDEGIRLHL